MNKKIVSKFLVLALAVGIFGVVTASRALAILTPPTSTTVDNVAPSFTVDPSDGRSSTATPTNVGANTTFTATATDPNTDSYYLVVCDSAGIVAATHTCDDGTTWATSTLTASGAQASVTRLAVIGDAQINAWYAYVCDNNTAPACSAASQGSDSPSPFNVNHAPTFGTVTVTDATAGGGSASIEPNDDIYFYLAANTGVDDIDNDTAQDTVSGYVCADAATAADTGTDTCTGGATICTHLDFDPNTTAFNCSSSTLVDAPMADTTYNYKVFFYDSHNFAGTGTNAQTYDVQNVAPTVGTYSVNNITLTSGASTTNSFTVLISDNNGWADVTSVDGLIFDDNAIDLSSGTCTANEKNCYLRPTCTLSSSTSIIALATCDAITVWYNANYSTPGDWRAHANPTDNAGTVTSGGNSGTAITVNSLQALSVAEATIPYGTVSAGGTSNSVMTSLQNAGNNIIDVGILGTDMSAGVPTINKSRQHWATSSGFTWGTGDYELKASVNTTPPDNKNANGCSNREIAVRASHAANRCEDATTECTVATQNPDCNGIGGGTCNKYVDDSTIFWKISILTGQASGAYTGTNTFSALANSACQAD